ncbi:hypothetical protein D3C75_954690 [compost metagenome]
MEIFELTQERVPKVARLMCTIKPEWWDYDGACGQLSDINESIKTVGWYLGEDEANPKGWILCRELIGFRTIELECSGFDDNGVFKLEHKLRELIDIASHYAKEKGYLTFRNAISSIGFNIHRQDIDDIPKAIQNLTCDRIDYKWMLDYGFKVIGIQPNVYEKGYHLILLAKEL